MRELGHINDAQMAEAQKQDLRIKRDVNEFGVRADYVAEMARQMAYRTLPGRRHTPAACASSPPFLKADQEAAYASLRRGVLDYDRRHGYRGAKGYADLGRRARPSTRPWRKRCRTSRIPATSTPP
jgi:penicillin-binding protein 1A